METKRIIIEDRNHIKDEELKEAAGILRSGGLVAFPTETVYGLGGNALDEDAARKIYAAKGRPSDNPLIAHVSCVEEVAPLVKEIPEAGRKLMEAFWPGPLTMIFPKSEKVPYGTTGGLDTVAIRMPDDPVANRLIALAGVPVAAPSANTSGRPSPTTADHVWQDMNGRIEMIIDRGGVHHCGCFIRGTGCSEAGGHYHGNACGGAGGGKRGPGYPGPSFCGCQAKGAGNEV